MSQESESLAGALQAAIDAPAAQLPAVQPQGNQLPAFVRADAPTGLETVRDVMMPSYVKIRQKTCKSDQINQMCDVGDVLLVPDLVPIFRKAEPSKPLQFVAVLCYKEYCMWGPYKMQDTLGFIVERTMDPNSDIAKRASSREVTDRYQICEAAPEARRAEKDYQYRYVEHLNYILFLRQDGVLNQMPVIQSFVSGEYKNGRRFGNLIGSRQGAPIYVGNYCATVSTRKNDDGEDWEGLDIVIDHANPWVTENEYNKLVVTHEYLYKKVMEGAVQANYAAGAEDVQPANVDDIGDAYDPTLDPAVSGNAAASTL